MDVADGKLQPLTPENIGCEHGEVSPDGKTLLFGDDGGQKFLHSLADGTTVPIKRFGKSETVLRWAADSRSLLVQGQPPPNARVDRFDIVTGERQLWREITLPDTTGVILAMADVHVAPSGSYCYTYMQSQADLYLVEGIR
jgi:Tol biopolymer transport system component